MQQLLPSCRLLCGVTTAWCNPKSAGAHSGDTEDLGLLGSCSHKHGRLPSAPTSLVPVPGTGSASKAREPSPSFPVCTQ